MPDDKKIVLQFFLPMKPPTVTAQQHRISARPGKKAQIYNTPELADAKQKFLSSLAAHVPERPMQGPVRLVVKWMFPLLKGMKTCQYKATRPDTDNLQKLFKDCMTQAEFWHDDAQIASEIIEKFYNDIPGIYVHCEEIEALP